MADYTSFSSSLTAGSSSFTVDDAFEDACSICLEPFSTDDPATVTSCKHEYHLQCILDWSQRSKECPICWQQFVLKDPASQELLAAVDSERRSRSRNISPAPPASFPEDFDTGLDATYLDYDDMEAHVMRHLATARFFRRREMQRYPLLDASLVLDSNSAANVPGTLPTNTTSPDFSNGSPESDLQNSDIRSSINVQSPSSDPGIAGNRDVPSKPRVFFRQTQPKVQGGQTNPRYCPSQSLSNLNGLLLQPGINLKSTRSLKDRLLAQNNSVKELSKEVQREMSAGIAGVAKMIERLDLTPKRTGTSIPPAGGRSSVLLKGKGVEESSINKRSVELAPDLSSGAPVSRTNSGQLEVSHQRGC